MQDGNEGTSGNEMQSFLDAINPATGQLKPGADTKAPDSGTDNTGTVDESVKEGAEGTDTPKATTETPQITEKKDEPAKGDETQAQSSSGTEAKDWYEVLQSQKVDRKEALKKFGLDDFDIELSEIRKNGGDPYRYLEVKSRDWSKKSDMDVLRHNLRQEYKDLPEEDFELIAEVELGKYDLQAPEQPDDLATEAEKQEYAAKKAAYEKQKRIVGIKMKSEADQYRKKFSEEDAKYVIPERKKDEEEQRQSEAIQQEKQQLKEYINGHESTKNLLTKKQLVFGEGEEAYNQTVDPAELLDYATTDGKFWSLFTAKNDKGEVSGLDVDLLLRTINYAKNRKTLEKALIDKGIDIGTKKESVQLRDTKDDSKGKPGEVSESLLDAFNKRGKQVGAGA